MIQAINLRQLRNSEFIRFHKQVLEICEKADPASLAIASQVNNLQTQVTQLDALFLKRGNPITEELEALDDRRDAALMGIRANLDSFAYHYEQSHRPGAPWLVSSPDSALLPADCIEQFSKDILLMSNWY